MKLLAGALNQEKDLIGALSVILKLHEGSFPALVASLLFMQQLWAGNGSNSPG